MTQAYGTYVLAVVGGLGAALALAGAGSMRRHRAYVPRYRPGSPSAFRQRALAIHSPVRAIEAGPRPRVLEIANDTLSEVEVAEVRRRWAERHADATAEYPLPRTDLERGWLTRASDLAPLWAPPTTQVAGTAVEDGPAYAAAIRAMDIADPFADVTDLAEHALLTATRAEMAREFAALDAELDAALQRFRDATGPTMATLHRWGVEADVAGVIDVGWRIDTDTAEWPAVRRYDTAEALLVS